MNTVYDHLLRRCREDGARPALWHRASLNPMDQSASAQNCAHHDHHGGFDVWTWQQLLDEVVDVVSAMRSWGIQPGDRVALWSVNRPEWVVIDLALHVIGAVHVPIHAPLSVQQALQQCHHSGAKLAIVDGAKKAAELFDHCRGSEPPTTVMRLETGPDNESSDVQLFREAIQATVSSGPRMTPDELAAIQQDVDINALATILYTSGTTGEPKGVMLSQANFMFVADKMERLFGSQYGQRRLNILPLSHIFARTCDMYVWLQGKSEFVLSSRDALYEDCRDLQPHTINGVPYLFQTMQRRIEGGETVGSLLGDRIAYCCVGGAPLAAETYDFFQRRGLSLLQGYGLTESSPVIAACTNEQDRRGSVGKPMPGIEVRVRDGELQTRGPHVMQGYYKNAEKTAEVMDGDWLCTGDLAAIDDDQFIFITGRKRELIVLSSGKNISPTLIESMLIPDPLIEQVVVIGDNRSHLAALVFPTRDNVDTAEIQAVIDVRLSTLSHHEQIRRCGILPRPLSMDAGELTAKLSVRRDVVDVHWSELIEQLYQPE